MNIRLPNITGESTEEKLKQIQSYLVQTAQDLNWALKQIPGNGSAYVPYKTANIGGNTNEIQSEAEKILKNFDNLKGLIIKSAEIVEAYSEEIKTRLEGVYVAQSEYGAFTEKTSADIAINSQKIEQSVTDTQLLAIEMEEAIRSSTAVLTHRSDGIDIDITNLRAAIDKKANQTQVNEITEHFRFSADGMTITNSATGMGINVSEQQVAFTGGNDPTTVITPNAMETTNLSVGVRLDVGGYSLIPRSNGNLSLRWTGG